MPDFISQSHIKAIDRDYWSPAERAIGINAIITNLMEQIEAATPDDVPTQWDFLCWAVEFAGKMALQSEVKPLIEAAKQLSYVLYSLHYSQAHKIYGAPDKRRSERRSKLLADERNVGDDDTKEASDV